MPRYLVISADVNMQQMMFDIVDSPWPREAIAEIEAIRPYVNVSTAMDSDCLRNWIRDMEEMRPEDVAKDLQTVAEIVGPEGIEDETIRRKYFPGTRRYDVEITRVEYKRAVVKVLANDPEDATVQAADADGVEYETVNAEESYNAKESACAS